MSDIKKAIEYVKKQLATALEYRNRDREGRANGSLGNAYQSLVTIEEPLNIMKTFKNCNRNW